MPILFLPKTPTGVSLFFRPTSIFELLHRHPLPSHMLTVLSYSNFVEPEEEAQSKHDTGMYGAVGDADGHVPKKRMSLVERFGKMFEAEVVCSKCAF
jgi:hypothetical protein